jgi:hypothetical protein
VTAEPRTQRTHIMRWAPQDYRTSRVRMRSAMTADPMLRTVYLELLNALHECGGELPADSAVLADELLLPADEIARCLPILAELGTHSSRGGIVISDGTVRNVRVCEDLRAAEEYRAEQALRGSVGGKARAKHSPSKRRAGAKQPSSQPLPLPLPLPTPRVLPSVERSDGARPAWTGNRETDASIAECYRHLREIEALGGEDPTMVMLRASGAGGKAKPVPRPELLREPALGLTLRDLQRELAVLKAKIPAPPVDLHAERGF